MKPPTPDDTFVSDETVAAAIDVTTSTTTARHRGESNRPSGKMSGTPIRTIPIGQMNVLSPITDTRSTPGHSGTSAAPRNAYTLQP